MVRLLLLAPSPSLLLWLTGFHQGAAFYRPGFHAPPLLTKRDWWFKLARWLGSLCFNLFWKSLHLGISMGNATVSGQPEVMCRGSLQWTSKSYRRNSSISRSEAPIALIVYV